VRRGRIEREEDKKKDKQKKRSLCLVWGGAFV
jgi:hypothetical protein